MALINKVNFTRFSRFGANLGRLTYTAATHEEATDGTDELKITCDEDLAKGERLVWVDRQGKVHEHIVDEIERLHDDSGKPYTSVTCINSINETWDDYIEDKRPSGSVAVALTSILAGTRWEVGNCDQPGSASHTFYHISVREGLSDLLKTWGGELETVVETDGVQVTHRYVRVVATRGNQQSPKRFTWTKDLISIKRKTGSANPKTRVYGYGKGVETDSGGYGRRLTFGDINNGKNYVEDASATEVWGHPDGSGGVAPAVDVYVNEQCEDAAQLLAETRDYLETVKTPTVSYEASVLDLFAFGRNWEGVAVGDCVAIIDKGFSNSGIRLKGRVSKISRDLVTGDATVTFGNLTDDLADIFQAMAQQLKSGSNQRANYDAAAGTSASWLNQLMAALNKAFNAVGTYKVETFELGTVWSNVPIDQETGVPLKATSGMWAVNINGMGIRLAADLTSDGQWNWRTFITGAQVSADCINAGTMRADRIRAGLLTDEVGANYWDLETGEFQLSPNAKYGDGGWTVDGVVEDLHGGIVRNTNNIESLGKDFQARNKEIDETISGLDKTVDDIAKDGIVTEAEKAAVAKVMQAIAQDRAWAIQDVTTLKKTSAALYGTGNTPTAAMPYNRLITAFSQAYGSTDEATITASCAYGQLKAAIDSIAECTTAEALGRAVETYKAAYSEFSTKVNAYLKVSQECHSLVEQYNAAQATDELLTQTEVFNRLTNNGATKGIYMTNGQLYVNATYLKSGIISDGQNKNYWSLTSGYFQTKYGSIGGLAIGDTKIYSGKLTLSSNTYGLYIGTDGFSVGSGSCYTALSNGYLYGGNANDITGYVGFNNYATDSGIYGTRLAGKGCVAVLTNGFFGIGDYKERSEYASVKTGMSGSVTLVGNLRSSWTNLKLTGTYNVSGICQNLSMNWTNYTLTFEHGLMNTSL
ncbi:phage tail spike protein [uncultured Senegalimassilia sp.]|uniref:phage tail spike protein n=1 Tax=uncultured Senegalimassilia sp. TaxID=1714350 RepID=UPI0026E03555|nr:phage tail spike protein [uncultured Senegalimassilia sp.]